MKTYFYMRINDLIAIVRRHENEEKILCYVHNLEKAKQVLEMLKRRTEN